MRLTDIGHICFSLASVLCIMAAIDTGVFAFLLFGGIFPLFITGRYVVRELKKKKPDQDFMKDLLK